MYYITLFMLYHFYEILMMNITYKLIYKQMYHDKLIVSASNQGFQSINQEKTIANIP